MTRRIPRVALIGRAVYGLLLLSDPQLLLRTGGEGRTPSWASTVVRLLGARHLNQSRVLCEHPELAGAGATADLAHALTDVLEATVSRRMRVPGLIDSAIATTLAVSSLLPPESEALG
ncbi:MAG TPA: hypothetical protein VLR26_02090 [Frankiaceae bacterium]|nr:hypothetical protein [Frankiaceae bacterium]